MFLEEGLRFFSKTIYVTLATIAMIHLTPLLLAMLFSTNGLHNEWTLDLHSLHGAESRGLL